MSRLGNGIGSVYKLSGKRKNPWVARKTIGFKINGQPNYKYIGYYRTKSEAMTALMDYNKAPYSLNGERLCDLYQGFYDNYSENHKEGTVKNIDMAWKLLEPLHEESISGLTRKQIQVFFDNLEVSRNQKKKVKECLKMMMDYSIRYDIIQPEKISIFKYIDISSQIHVRTIEREVFTDEEINNLWQMDDDFARLLLFLIYTGLRAGEYCDLTEDSIDEDMVIHIEDSKTAAGIRSVPLSDKALKLLPLPKFKTYKSMYGRFDVWREKNGIGHNFHDTRHTCVSRLAEAKVDRRIIQAIVGHKGKNVTDDVYTHFSIDVMREALNRI